MFSPQIVHIDGREKYIPVILWTVVCLEIGKGGGGRGA